MFYPYGVPTGRHYVGVMLLPILCSYGTVSCGEDVLPLLSPYETVFCGGDVPTGQICNIFIPAIDRLSNCKKDLCRQVQNIDGKNIGGKKYRWTKKTAMYCNIAVDYLKIILRYANAASFEIRLRFLFFQSMISRAI